MDGTYLDTDVPVQKRSRMSPFVKNFILPLISLIILAVTFSFVLLICDANEFNGLDEANESDSLLKYLNRLYFTMTTISTVGYGDISPASVRAKVITMVLQALVTIGTVTTLITLFKCS